MPALVGALLAAGPTSGSVHLKSESSQLVLAPPGMAAHANTAAGATTTDLLSVPPRRLIFLFENAAELGTAVTAWCDDQPGALVTYGEMSLWDVSIVNNFDSLFGDYCKTVSEFDEDLSSWDTGSAMSMGAMFQNAGSFNSDLSSWDVGQVTSFAAMFQNATLFDQDLSAWTVSNGGKFSNMFYGAEVRDLLRFLGSEPAQTFASEPSICPRVSGLQPGHLGLECHGRLFICHVLLCHRFQPRPLGVGSREVKCD